jgi:hypothetical protein
LFHLDLLVKVRPMRHSLPARFLLIFSLLFAQMGGLVHGISHVREAQSQDQSAQHDKLCELCATFAQIGSAIGSSSIHFETSSNHEARHPENFTATHTSLFVAFTARAPPCSA